MKKPPERDHKGQFTNRRSPVDRAIRAAVHGDPSARRRTPGEMARDTVTSPPRRAK